MGGCKWLCGLSPSTKTTKRLAKRHLSFFYSYLANEVNLQRVKGGVCYRHKELAIVIKAVFI